MIKSGQKLHQNVFSDKVSNITNHIRTPPTLTKDKLAVPKQWK